MVRASVNFRLQFLNRMISSHKVLLAFWCHIRSSKQKEQLKSEEPKQTEKFIENEGQTKVTEETNHSKASSKVNSLHSRQTFGQRIPWKLMDGLQSEKDKFTIEKVCAKVLR